MIDLTAAFRGEWFQGRVVLALELETYLIYTGSKFLKLETYPATSGTDLEPGTTSSRSVLVSTLEPVAQVI